MNRSTFVLRIVQESPFTPWNTYSDGSNEEALRYRSVCGLCGYILVSVRRLNSAYFQSFGVRQRVLWCMCHSIPWQQTFMHALPSRRVERFSTHERGILRPSFLMADVCDAKSSDYGTSDPLYLNLLAQCSCFLDVASRESWWGDTGCVKTSKIEGIAVALKNHWLYYHLSALHRSYWSYLLPLALNQGLMMSTW